jgi:colanic acid biosynthesis protein WcaH
MSDPAYRHALYYLPIPTCDVMLLSPSRNATLLFKRTNKPVQGVFYSIGGRLLKNESLRSCASRKLRSEFGIKHQGAELLFAGAMEEVFTDSAYDGVNSHCVNSVFAYTLSTAEMLMQQSRQLLSARLDAQHSDSRWFSTSDPSLHPYVATKLGLVFDALERPIPRRSSPPVGG